MLQIEIKVGREVKVIRGTSKGHLELGEFVDMKKDDEMVPTFVPRQFYNSFEALFTKVLMMKVCRSDVDTLHDLKETIVRERKNLKAMFDGFLTGLEEQEQEEEPKPRKKRTRKPVQETNEEEPEPTPTRRRRKPRKEAKAPVEEEPTETRSRRRRRVR